MKTTIIIRFPCSTIVFIPTKSSIGWSPSSYVKRSTMAKKSFKCWWNWKLFIMVSDRTSLSCVCECIPLLFLARGQECCRALRISFPFLRWRSFHLRNGELGSIVVLAWRTRRSTWLLRVTNLPLSSWSWLTRDKSMPRQVEKPIAVDSKRCPEATDSPDRSCTANAIVTEGGKKTRWVSSSIINWIISNEIRVPKGTSD